jgi:hypothetical protein
MGRPYKRKHAKLYTQDKLVEAIDKVKRGELRISDAVREYRGPRTTLKNHVTNTNNDFKVGRKTTLTEDKEKLLLHILNPGEEL